MVVTLETRGGSRMPVCVAVHSFQSISINQSWIPIGQIFAEGSRCVVQRVENGQK